jgi:hypothetical protein
MTIGASRMYRGLDDFLSSDMYDILLFPSSLFSLHENPILAHTYPIKAAAESQTHGPGVQPCQHRSMG